MTGSGGHGALAVDACTDHGLAVPSLPVPLQQELREQLSRSARVIASVSNPIDLTGSAVDDDFVVTVRRLSKTPEIDCIMIADEVARTYFTARREHWLINLDKEE